MAISSSPRLGLTRWSADTDQVSRAQFDGDHGRLDDLVAMAIQGVAVDRPAAAVPRRLYYATDTGVLSLDTGTAWVEVLTEPRASAAYLAKADNLASLADKPAARANLGADAAYVPTGAVKANVATFESTTATTASDLATIGPTESIVVPPSGLVRIDLQATMRNTTVGEQTYLGYATSGAFAAAAVLDEAVTWDMDSAEYLTLTLSALTNKLTPGQTLTVTAKYWVAAGTGWFGRRRLILTPQ
jgi:hypothetical protein